MQSKLQSIGKNLIGFAQKAWRGSPWHIFILTAIVAAALIPAVANGIMAEIVTSLFAALNLIFGALANFLAAIVQWLITPTAFDFVENDAIQAAWRMVRDFVNLGFVLAIVVIAIGFILRMQTYGSSKTLSRLIIAAILVNFSLVIAGLFIDVSALITGTFLKEFQFTNIAAQILTSTGFRDMLLPSDRSSFIGKALGFLIRLYPPVDAAATLNVIAKGLLTSLFSIIMISTLAALVIMLLIRIARLWFLLVLAPVAWFSWIFPALEKNWHKWWDEFLRWTFFPPIVVFFLALSINILGSYTGPEVPPPPTSFLAKAINIIKGALSNALVQGEPITASAARFFIAIMLIIFSMMMANQLSITFADTGLKWARGIAVWPGLTAWRAGVRVGKRRVSTGVAAGRLGKWAERKFAGNRVFGGVADWVRKTRTAGVAPDVENIMQRYTHMVDETLRDIALDRTRELQERIAAARQLSARGQFQIQFSTGQQETLLGLANSADPQHAMDIMLSNPDLATYYDARVARSPAEEVGGVRGLTRRMPTNRTPKLSISQLSNPNIVDGFTAGHFRVLANEGDPARINAIRTQLHIGTPLMNAKLAEIMRHADLAAIFG